MARNRLGQLPSALGEAWPARRYRASDRASSRILSRRWAARWLLPCAERVVRKGAHRAECVVVSGAWLHSRFGNPVGGGTQVALAVLENGGSVTGNQIHMI
jgi:hypothetical protein